MPVIYLDESSIEQLTEKDIKKIIDDNSYNQKYDKLDDYYIGKHDILNYVKKDSTSPNNKIVVNIANYVTNTMVGYFIGKPVIYSSENETYLKKMQDIFDYNDEQDENAELAKKSSIQGNCFEMLYMDEEAKIRFTKIHPRDLILIYATGDTDPKAAIRTVISVTKNNDIIKKVEFWTYTEVWRFHSFNGGSLVLDEVEEHYWQDVPFVEYLNNEERQGDFEGIITQIDAYNKVQSNTANLFEYNDNAILKITKMGDFQAKDIRSMKESGAIILEDGGDIDWLIKNMNDAALENHKKRLREDMHTCSGTPNLTDESFGGNLSGVAMSYKLWPMEQICGIKERKFKRGLQRRIELITNILNIQGGNYDYRDIQVQFRRNKPQSLLEISQIMNNLAAELSQESRLKLWPEIDNVQDEIQRLRDEEKQGNEDFGNYKRLAEAFRSASLASVPEDNQEPPPTGDEE